MVDSIAVAELLETRKKKMNVKNWLTIVIVDSLQKGGLV